MSRPQFAELLSGARKLAQFAVAHGQSPIMGLVASNANEAHLTLTSQFLTAFASTGDGSSDGWVTARGLVAMAEYIFHQHSDFRRLPAPNQDAMYYGAITAMWTVASVENPITNEKITTARSLLSSKIRHMPPPTALIKQALTSWILNWRKNNMQHKHNLLLQWFPLQLSSGATEQFIQSIHASCNGDPEEANVEITDAQAVALRELRDAEGLASVWRNMSSREVVAFFVVLSYENSRYEIDVLRANFCMIATTTKTSFSDQWLNSRWSNLQSDNALLADTEVVEREVLTLYETYFQRPVTSIAKKVSILYFAYFLAHRQRMESVMRLIEQSRAPHVSGLTALCNLTLRFPAMTYSVLSQTFGLHQVHNIVKLAAYLINNPYATLVSTPVPVAMYADIAFVATEVLYAANTNRRARTARYVSPAEKSLTKSIEYLRAFATNLVAEQEQIAKQDVSINAVLTAYGYSISETHDNSFVLTPISDLAPQERREGEPGETARIVVPKTNLDAFIRSKRIPQDDSFIAIMTELNKVVAQCPLPLPTSEDAQVSAAAMTTRVIPQEIIDHIKLIGVTIDESWTSSKALLDVNTMPSYRVSLGLALSGQHRSAPAQNAADRSMPPPPPPGPQPMEESRPSSPVMI